MYNNRENFYRVALIAVLSLLSFVGVMMEVRSPLVVSPVTVLDPFFLFWGRQVSKGEKRVKNAFEVVRYWDRLEVEKELLQYSNSIRLEDDLTMLAIHLHG